MHTRKTLLLSLLLVGFISCSKDEGNNTVPNEFPPVKPEIQYYVKYDVKMNMLRKKGNRTILFKTPKGDERVTYNFVYGTTTWNGTFGPFKSGDEVYLNCTMETDGVIESSISVSEDGKPFVVKRHGELSYSDNCRLSYTLGNP